MPTSDSIRDWLERRKGRRSERPPAYPEHRPPAWEGVAKFLGTLIGGAVGAMAMNGTLGEVLERTQPKEDVVSREVYDRLATRVEAFEQRTSTCEWQTTAAKERADKALEDSEAARLKAEALEKWARQRGYRPPKR